MPRSRLLAPPALETALASCRLCPRSCGANRLEGETGFCRATGRFFDDFVHFGEEEKLVPSYTVFFTGCNLRCAFCSNFEYVENPSLGRPADPRYFRRKITAFARRGVRNVNFLGGEPTCNLPAIAKIFSGWKSPLPIVWNSNFYFSQAALPHVLALADIFLADFKFGNDSCARRLARAAGYLDVVTANLLAVAPLRETIVRHLLVPGHFDCCTIPVLDWLAARLPKAAVSILASFIPPRRPGVSREIDRTVSPEEVEKALKEARKRRLSLVS